MLCLACSKTVETLNEDHLCDECARWTQVCVQCHQARPIFNLTCECELTYPETACAFCSTKHTHGRMSTIWNGKICLACVEKFSRCKLCNTRLNINRLCDCSKEKPQQLPRQNLEIVSTQTRPLPGGRSFGFMFHPLNGRNAFLLADTHRKCSVNVQMTDRLKAAIIAEMNRMTEKGTEQSSALLQMSHETEISVEELKRILL